MDLRQPDSFFVAALTALDGDELALANIEALPKRGFPFMETGLAERDALGAFSKARLAGGLEVDDVGHSRLHDGEMNLFPFLYDVFLSFGCLHLKAPCREVSLSSTSKTASISSKSSS
jgi:hypothetical protein